MEFYLLSVVFRQAGEKQPTNKIEYHAAAGKTCVVHAL
jgi:hypothetical protein